MQDLSMHSQMKLKYYNTLQYYNITQILQYQEA